MKRRDFVKKSSLGLVGLPFAASMLSSKRKAMADELRPVFTEHLGTSTGRIENSYIMGIYVGCMEECHYYYKDIDSGYEYDEVQGFVKYDELPSLINKLPFKKCVLMEYDRTYKPKKQQLLKDFESILFYNSPANVKNVKVYKQVVFTPYKYFSGNPHYGASSAYSQFLIARRIHEMENRG